MTDIVAVPVKQTISPDDRWEQGIEHDPRSVSIMHFLADYDYKYCDDCFNWKFGGDGDNGEQLMYELDEYFAAAPKVENCAVCGYPKHNGPCTGEPEITAPKPDVKRRIVCHAKGDRCHGCDHYQGKADVCKFAPKPATTGVEDWGDEDAAFWEGYQLGLSEAITPKPGDELARLVIEAYQAGYGRGHNDTVESCYNRSIEEEPDAALEWLNDHPEWVRVKEQSDG